MRNWIHSSHGKFAAFLLLLVVSMFAVVTAEHHRLIERITKLERRVQVITREIQLPGHNLTRTITMPGKPGAPGRVTTVTVTITKTLPGKIGPRGLQGPQGRPGKNGKNGKNGLNGVTTTITKVVQVPPDINQIAQEVKSILCQQLLLPKC